MSGTHLSLASDEVAVLGTHLGRLRSWDERSAVRVQIKGAVVGLYAGLPMDVLSLVVLPLRESASELVDVTVSAGRLRDVLGDLTRPTDRDVALPDPITGPPSIAVLPPKTRWLLGEVGMAGDVVPRVDAAVATFRESVPSSGSFQAEWKAEAAWEAPGWGGVPMRALHAARLLGFLGHPGARIRTGTHPGWKRLETPMGQVFVRAVGAPPRLTLVPSPR